MSRRALNRATLSRQFLLTPAGLTVPELVEHLVGVQAQTPHTWYVGLWARLASCDPVAVGDLLTKRQLVRIALLRSTIHLVTARDALALRGLLQPVGVGPFQSNFGRRLAGVDIDEVAVAGRALVEEQPLTFSALGRRLAQRWPGRDEAALAQAIRAYVPLVQVPPRGVWGLSGQAAHTSLESWLGRPLDTGYPVAALVRRYLRAFGPASVKDAQVWCGLTRLAEVFDALRPELVVSQDEHGVELFDLPDAPRPEPATPAPARFLYDFDNVLLSHADRSRIVTEAYASQDFEPHGPVPRLVLVDGFTAATWTTQLGRGTATLTIRPFGRLGRADQDELVEEGGRLLDFLAPGAVHDVVLPGTPVSS